jgi:hypothetical protein
MDGQLRIDSLWAFTQVDTDGTEGVIGQYFDKTGWMPLMGADLAMVAKLRPHAQVIATATGRPVVLSHYSLRTDQETIQP